MGKISNVILRLEVADVRHVLEALGQTLAVFGASGEPNVYLERMRVKTHRFVEFDEPLRQLALGFCFVDEVVFKARVDKRPRRHVELLRRVEGRFECFYFPA